MLKAKGLRKAVVPPALIGDPSPGNLQPTRLALHVSPDGSSCYVFIASGSRVFKLQISMEESSVVEGKDSLLIPVQTKVLDSLLLNRCPHRSEIQSLVLAEVDRSNDLLLGTVDSYGHLIVSKLDATGKDADRFTYSVLPQNSGLGEGSWAGLCFSPSEMFTAAVAHSFGRTVDIYDQDVHVRTLRTLWYPTALTFIQNLSSEDGSSILAVTEGCQLTIWDLRMKENGGCVQRICGSVGDNFYAVCTSSNGNIAVGGADRTVTIYDPRRWSALTRWVHCSKYEITGLAFSSIDSDYIYVQGVDYEASNLGLYVMCVLFHVLVEVFCGQWKESKKVFSLRGDSNWLGFSKSCRRDVLGGWCDSGSIFLTDVANDSKADTSNGFVNGLS